MTASQPKTKILAVVGSTASGKTDISLCLAQKLNGEIISCDSMQVYRRMDVGTAKPTAEERAGIPHHLIDIAEPDQPFSCAEYVKAAQAAIEDVSARGKLPILCGGTGLYLDSLLRGGNFEETDTDPALRQELLELAQRYGNHALHERLTAIDPESAAAIHENNVKRVIRAIEIYETTGKTKSELDRQSRVPPSPYDATVIGLRYADREILYDRINRRVDLMLENGLLEETRRLLNEGVFTHNATAAQAIGYKELLGHLRGEESPAEATERLKQATRRYAKRQITWFGAKDYVRWVDMTRNGAIRPREEILRDIFQLLNQPS